MTRPGPDRRRGATRYTGVWDAGHEAGMEDAWRILRRAVYQGVEFSADAGDAFIRNQVAARVGDRAALLSGMAPLEALLRPRDPGA